MSITKRTIDKLCKLSRINLSEAEVLSFLPALKSTIELASQIQKLNVTDIHDETMQLTQGLAELRLDNVTEKDQRAAFQKIAPSTKANLYIVPQVIE